MERTAVAGPFPDKYDATIKAAAERHLPDWDWRLLKAQYWQESHLDPNARSRVGAEGIAQFMPETSVEVWKYLGYGTVDRRLAEPSIYGGAYYLGTLMRYWKAPRTDLSRRRFAQASYNAGAGGVGKAQKRCGGGMEYPLIERCLPGETRTYVRLIERWYGAMQ